MPECQGRWQANYDNAVRLSMQWQLWQSIVNSLPISESLVAIIILSPIYLLSPIHAKYLM